MGKRKREKEDCEDYDYIVHKLKKLERKLRHGRRRRRHYDDSESSISSRGGPLIDSEEGGPALECNPSAAEDDLLDEYTIRSVVNIPGPSTSTAEPIAPCRSPLVTPPPPPPLPPPPPPIEFEIASDVTVVPEKDSDILEILGDDPSLPKQYGNEIQNDVAVRLQHIATTGLPKDLRKELYEKYLPPSNCTLIDAPELNPEIKAAVSEAVIKRDKAIELKQKQLGRAITCIGEAITTLMSKGDKDTAVIKLLMDASRLLCDNQNLDSVTRRNFVLFNLKKDMKDQMQKTKVDKLFFGEDLADTLKTAKTISKSGADLKAATSTNKPTTTRPKSGPPPQTAPPQPHRNNLNWKAPPLNRRPQGNPRPRGSAPRFHHAGSSRTSYRAPQRQYNSRR